MHTKRLRNMDDQLAPRVAVVARNSAEFMRSAARPAALTALELMDVVDAYTCVQISLMGALAMASIWRRAPSQAVADRLRRLLLSAVALNLNVDVQLMPQIISLDPLISKHRTIDSLSASWSWRNCRFRKGDLPRVLNVLRLPHVCHLENRAAVPAETVMIVSLFTLSKPRTQDDTAAEFGFANQTIVSRIYNYFCKHVRENFAHLVQQADDDDDGFLIWAPYIAFFQDCIHAVSMRANFRDVAMITDGTFRPACRPKQRPADAIRNLSTQRRVYSGV
jgi:hypothetical protein